MKKKKKWVLEAGGDRTMSKEVKKSLEELKERKIDENLLEEVAGGESPFDNSKSYKGNLSEATKKKMREYLKKK